jgi:hypothetical protein
MAKCSIHPIHRSPKQVKLASNTLGCEVAMLPCKYLGLPLGPRKVNAAQLQPVVDSASSRLQPWCAKLLNRGGANDPCPDHIVRDSHTRDDVPGYLPPRF